MNDFKLKIILSILGGIIFSFIFILLAFVIPLDNKHKFSAKPKSMLEQVSHSLK